MRSSICTPCRGIWVRSAACCQREGQAMNDEGCLHAMHSAKHTLLLATLHFLVFLPSRNAEDIVYVPAACEAPTVLLLPGTATYDSLHMSGADKVSIGSDAVDVAEEYIRTGVRTGQTSIEQISEVYGRQAVVVSIDPKRVYVADPSQVRKLAPAVLADLVDMQ
eukprot:1159831-Pelagomonas_calceolata.AAC.16